MNNLFATEEQVKALTIAHASLLSALSTLVDDVNALVSESEGVAGLHRNGDVAPWVDLLPGGQYGEWLAGMERAEREIERAKGVVAG